MSDLELSEEKLNARYKQLMRFVDKSYKECYARLPTRAYNIEMAYNIGSKTQIIPFIISHECNESYIDRNDKPAIREREFYVFDDVYHYLRHMKRYPHSHELVTSTKLKGHVKGILVFDIDIKEKLYVDNWVRGDFYAQFRVMISTVLKEFYDIEEDISEHMNWMYTPYKDKYSRHLTISNIYLCENWEEQIKVFYSLCNYIILRDKLFDYMGDKVVDLIDMSIAHVNATLRLPFNSKIGGKDIIIEEWKGPESFFKCLIQVYDDREDMIYIGSTDVNRSKIREILGIKANVVRKISRFDNNEPKEEKPAVVNSFVHNYMEKKRSLIHGISRAKLKSSMNPHKYLKDVLYLLEGSDDYTPIELPDGVVKEALEIVSSNKDIMSTYKYRKVNDRSMIILDRIKDKGSKCLISGNHHDRRGAFVIINGPSLRFYCGKKECENNQGIRYIEIGRVKNTSYNRAKPEVKTSIPKPRIPNVS